LSRIYELLHRTGYTPLVIDNDRRKTAPETRLLTTRLGNRPAPPTSDESDFDIRGLIQILIRRRFWILLCTATMLVVAALVCIFMPPKYRAVSRIELFKQDVGVRPLADMTDQDGGGYVDPLDFNLTLQTQMKVLGADALAWQVIKELNLADTREFGGSPPAKTATANQQTAESSEPTPSQRAAILRKFEKNLKVDGVSGTRLITVSYTDPDPKMAAKIVNQLVSDFVEYNFQVRYNATSKATDFLAKELADLKSQVEKAQAHAAEVQKESGIFGEDERHNIVIARLDQLNNELTSAEADRVVKESLYKLARSGNPELIAGMLGANAQPNAPGAANSLALLTNLRQQEANLNAEYADAAAKYGPAYPRLIETKKRLDSVHDSIATELAKVVRRANREYELAAAREAKTRKAFTEQKALAAQMNNKAVDFLVAKHEADSSWSVYEHLLEKLKQADLLAGLRSSQLHVVDVAAIPDRPVRPNVPLYLAFGTLAGLTLGVVCVFVIDSMDRTIFDIREIEATTYVPVLGVIPRAGLVPETRFERWLNAPMRSGRNGAAHKASLQRLQNAAVAEAFRSVRTSLLLSRPDQPPQVLMITSSIAQEGKSFASLNLAAAFAYKGDYVLLVDADLRRGTLSRVLTPDSAIGLTQVLSRGADREAYRRIDDVPGLTFLPAGAPSAHPSESLGSQQMAALLETWRRHFAYVVIDTPPVLPVTDAVVLSPKMDAVIVVVRFAVSLRPSIIRTIRMLQDVQAGPLGVMVNAMEVHSPEYQDYSGSHGYDEYHKRGSGELLLVPPSSEPASKGESS
jgi:polysaccharide biosynthesis transport protein